MNYFLNMFSYANDCGSYEYRKIARLEYEAGKHFGVSTAYTSDEGYETAILDIEEGEEEVYPVERYSSKEEAIKGHEKWVKKAKEGKIKNIIVLGGFNGLVEDEKKVLKLK
jgi:hypothetical protein